MRKDYEILGIQEDADEKKIKRAYFKLIREYSPEKNPERFPGDPEPPMNVCWRKRISPNMISSLNFPKMIALH